MPSRKQVNPFYIILVIVGVAFVITATSYGVMAFIATRNPGAIALSEHPLWELMDEHGVTIMGVELALLAISSFAAMATDSYWIHSDNSSESNIPQAEEQIAGE